MANTLEKEIDRIKDEMNENKRAQRNMEDITKIETLNVF
jgi:hypothetical protein